MLTKILSYKNYFLGALFGAIVGYFYWKYFGCTRGCAITGSPLNSSLYFAAAGALLGGSYTSKKEENNKKKVNKLL